MRSMGAAAVFETAAETPPTVGHVSKCVWSGPTAAQSPWSVLAVPVGEGDTTRGRAGLTYSGSRPRRTVNKSVSGIPLMVLSLSWKIPAPPPTLTADHAQRSNVTATRRRNHRQAMPGPIGDCNRGGEACYRQVANGARRDERAIFQGGVVSRQQTYRHAQDLDILLARHLGCLLRNNSEEKRREWRVSSKLCGRVEETEVCRMSRENKLGEPGGLGGRGKKIRNRPGTAQLLRCESSRPLAR